MQGTWVRRTKAKKVPWQHARDLGATNEGQKSTLAACEGLGCGERRPKKYLGSMRGTWVRRTKAKKVPWQRTRDSGATNEGQESTLAACEGLGCDERRPKKYLGSKRGTWVRRTKAKKVPS